MLGTIPIAKTAGLLLALGGPAGGPVSLPSGSNASARPTSGAIQAIGGSHLNSVKIGEPSKRASCPVWKKLLAAAASDLGDLKVGWDGYGAEPISSSVIFKCLSTVEMALAGLSDGTAPYLVPAANGSVQIEWHEEHGELEFCIHPDGKAFIWLHNYLTGAEFEGDDEKATALFYRWAPWMASKRFHAGDVQVPQARRFFAFAA